ncbi:MAG: sugar phosphate isomerase/epimerase [Spirochaetes bacterium]|nr:sugar phosphate isomerase/epimerase [Spirochaetota bacterium]
MKILLNTIMLEPKRWANPKSVTIPLVKLLPDIKKAGFSELEIWGYHVWNLGANELGSLIRELRKIDISVPSLASYLTAQGSSKREDILNVAQRYFYLCKKLGSKQLRVFYGNRGFKESDKEYLEFIDEVFYRIFKMGQEKNIQVMAEMHDGTVIDSIEGLQRVLENRPDDFGVVYQPYEFKTESAIKTLEAVSGHIYSVHLQNRHRGSFAGLSRGDVDYRRILSGLSASGYDGPFVLEFTEGVVPVGGDFDYRSVLVNAVKDREWLKAVWERRELECL